MIYLYGLSPLYHEKTIVVCPNWTQCKYVAERLEKRGYQVINNSNNYFYLLNYDVTVIPMIEDGCNIRGLRAKDIIVHNSKDINQETLKLVIHGCLVVNSDPITAIKE